MNSILSEAFKIPSHAWWRVDLVARLDNSTDVKWSYPQICSASDVLSYLVRAAESSDVQATTQILNAYMAHQYSIDREVKFKQVELKKTLLQLFVDLPLFIQQRHLRGRRSRTSHSRTLVDDVAEQLYAVTTLRDDFDESFILEEQDGLAA